MDPLAILATLLVLPSLAQTKTNVLAICRAAGLSATSFILGEPSERWIEISARVMDAWGAVPSAACKGFFLDLATDPGDPGDLSADQTPRAGWLSALGSGWYGTTRGGRTFATAFVTLTNTSSSPITFGPGQLTVESQDVAPDGGSPTYRNVPDPSIYTNLGGTLTLAVNASVTLGVIADQIGSYGSAVVGHISILVTQSFGSMSVTGSTLATGQEREDPDVYRARCRLAADKLSPGGPARGYRYTMNTAIDGTPLQRFDGSGAVTITTAYVSPASATGEVTIYYAGPAGPVDDIDVSSANANIAGTALGVITNPLGIVPDAVTLLPLTSDPNTGGPGGATAIATPIALTYTARLRASQVPGGATPGVYTTGGSPPAAIATLFTTIAAAVGSYLPGLGPGGVDAVAGEGVVYTDDILCTVRDAASGLYAVAVTAPSTPFTFVLLGHVATLDGTAISGTLTVVAG